MLPRDSIYCEAVYSPQDIYYEGSEDEDYGDAEARRQRYEAAGQQFLAGRVPMLLSAALKGPFDDQSGWVNPWRSKNRTAHSQHRPASQPVGSQYSLRRPASASASPVAQRQAMQLLKNAECALPSPESLKQASFTEARSNIQGKVASPQSWREGGVSLASTKDGYDSWAASSPSRKLIKRKSKSSIRVYKASPKRQKTGSSELEIKTPTRRRQTQTSKAGEQHTKASPNTSSIYSHIRELTSKIPRQAVSSEDSEDGDASEFEDEDPLIDHPLTDSSLAKSLNPSSTFPQPSLFRALSPVSISPAHTPTKRGAPPTQSPNRPQASSGFSYLSEAPTSLSKLSDLEMPGADGDGDGDDLDLDNVDAHIHNTTASEPLSGEEETSFPESTEDNEENNGSDTSDLAPQTTVPRTTPPTGFDYDEPTTSSDDASTAENAQGGFTGSLETNYKIPHGLIRPFRATTPTRTAHPIIYDDAEGSDDSPPDSSTTALSSAQQPAANHSEASSLSKDAPDYGNSSRTNSPLKSSALQSLSPRNGRINSRPSPNKTVQPYHSSPHKSSAAVDKGLYLQEEDSRQSKENVKLSEAKQNPLSQVIKHTHPISQPSLSEIAADSTCKADHSRLDKSQQEPLARDTAVPPTTSSFNRAPIEAVSSAAMDAATQSNVLPDVPEPAESRILQQDPPADSQPSPPVETNASLDTSETHIDQDTSESANELELATGVADNHVQTRQQEEEKQTLKPSEASECLVTPPQSMNTQQASSEDLPPPADPVYKRPATPEPQFAFTSFSSFMSPSPSHLRQARYSFAGLNNGVAPTSHGILVSSKTKTWRGTATKKRVSWAPLPHEGADGSGETISSETNTSPSLSRGRDRAVSPPPPPSTGLASDSLLERDMKFSHHFAAVADRSKSIQAQNEPTASGRGSCSPDRRQAPAVAAAAAAAQQIAIPARITSFPKANRLGGEKRSAKLASRGGWDNDSDGKDNDPMDIVQDIFNEMDDFLQVWDVDAELNEARKVEKERAAADRKKKAETLSKDDDGDVGMGTGMDFDFASQLF